MRIGTAKWMKKNPEQALGMGVTSILRRKNGQTLFGLQWEPGSWKDRGKNYHTQNLKE